MAHGDLFIRCYQTIDGWSTAGYGTGGDYWYDTYDNWGVSLEDGALSELMTPPSAKEYITNECRLENGTRYAAYSPKVAQRDITLSMHLVAKNQTEFFNKYNNFCLALRSGRIDFKTKYQQGIVYRCRFVSCTQYSQFLNGMAKFALKLIEPDPTNR